VNPVFVVDVFGYPLRDTFFVTLGLTAVLTMLLWLASRRMRPHGLSYWQTALESYVGWVRSTVEGIFDDDPEPYVPLIGTLVAFIGVSNLLSLVPLVRPPTADLSTTVALSLIVFGAVPYFGIRRLGVRGYLRKYLDPHPILMPLNLMGEVTRTLALAVRLFGNVMSGQMVGAIVLAVASALVPIPLLMLGILTGLVQAYIFGILAAVYIAAAVEAGDSPLRPQPGIPTDLTMKEAS
jgi:F-type H+-transporting ATPase subunit a